MGVGEGGGKRREAWGGGGIWYVWERGENWLGVQTSNAFQFAKLKYT